MLKIVSTYASVTYFGIALLVFVQEASGIGQGIVMAFAVLSRHEEKVEEESTESENGRFVKDQGSAVKLIL